MPRPKNVYAPATCCLRPKSLAITAISCKTFCSFCRRQTVGKSNTPTIPKRIKFFVLPKPHSQEETLQKQLKTIQRRWNLTRETIPRRFSSAILISRKRILPRQANGTNEQRRSTPTRKRLIDTTPICSLRMEKWTKPERKLSKL